MPVVLNVVPRDRTLGEDICLAWRFLPNRQFQSALQSLVHSLACEIGPVQSCLCTEKSESHEFAHFEAILRYTERASLEEETGDRKEQRGGGRGEGRGN